VEPAATNGPKSEQRRAAYVAVAIALVAAVTLAFALSGHRGSSRAGSSGARPPAGGAGATTATTGKPGANGASGAGGASGATGSRASGANGGGDPSSGGPSTSSTAPG